MLYFLVSLINWMSTIKIVAYREAVVENFSSNNLYFFADKKNFSAKINSSTKGFIKTISKNNKIINKQEVPQAQFGFYLREKQKIFLKLQEKAGNFYVAEFGISYYSPFNENFNSTQALPMRNLPNKLIF